MYIYALPWRRSASVTLAMALSVPAALFPAGVPVKKIVLYKHGIAYFEREGIVPGGEEARLDFKNSEMNDVLKSLTIFDISGARVTAVRYDSNETLAQRLAHYPFTIGNQELLSAFLDSMKGARIELKSGDRVTEGAILGARAFEAGADAEKRIVREQVTLLLDSGDVANFDLGSISSLRFSDNSLQQQLKQYLSTIAQVKTRDKRSIYIDSSQGGTRNLRISYISPAAIWKSSYRLTLGDVKSMLEGWAIVDNTTDEDWNGVNLSVVSGRPISFVSLLDIPRYGPRQVAELPEDRAAGPVVYSGSVEAAAKANLSYGSGKGNGYGPGTGGGVGGGVYQPGAGLTLREQSGTHLGTGNEPLGPEAKWLNPTVTTQSEVSSVEGAGGATLGELFEYKFGAPITIKKNQSAMLPFLQDKVAARKLLIYTERDGEHPVNAAELTNSTSKTLDGGPVTVYDGGAYAGEALFETLKAGDKRLIGYAVDYGTRITTAFGSGEQSLREVHVASGTLQLRYSQHQTRTYLIKNVDDAPKTLIIQQEGINDYSVLSPKPIERTASAYRFEVKVPANGSQALQVQQERILANDTEILSSTPDFLASIIENKKLAEETRKQLQSIADLKRHIVEAGETLNQTKIQMADLTQDQTRLRQNIDSLNRVHGQEDQVRKYSAQLADNEVRFAALRDRNREVGQRKAALESQLRAAIDALTF